MSDRLIHFTVANYIVESTPRTSRIAANWKFMGKIIGMMLDGVQGEFGRDGLLRTG